MKQEVNIDHLLILEDGWYNGKTGKCGFKYDPELLQKFKKTFEEWYRVPLKFSISHTLEKNVVRISWHISDKISVCLRFNIETGFGVLQLFKLENFDEYEFNNLYEKFEWDVLNVYFVNLKLLLGE